LTSARNACSVAAMSNVLGENKQQQVLALGRLGWSLRRIEEATDVRRETASGYLKAAGVAVRGRGGRPRALPPKPAITTEVSTDSGTPNRAITAEVSTDPRPPVASWVLPEGECLRAVPRADCRGAGPWPQRHGPSGKTSSTITGARRATPVSDDSC
jgi:hypothetical protein